MHHRQTHPQHFLCRKQVAQIGTAEFPAYRAVALRINGALIQLVPGIFELWQAVIAQTEIPQIQLTAGRLILWLILIANIAIGGFDLSSADLENSATGLMMLLAVFLITALILSQFTMGPLVAQTLQNWLAPFYWSMIFALLINLLMLGILSLLSRLG